MNLDQIAARISAPNTCQGTEIPALKELTEKYPFAQVFSVLYLKALSNQNDLGFDEALQKHAYKVTDRMKLYDLIQERAVQGEEEEEIASFPEESSPLIPLQREKDEESSVEQDVAAIATAAAVTNPEDDQEAEHASPPPQSPSEGGSEMRVSAENVALPPLSISPQGEKAEELSPKEEPSVQQDVEAVATAAAAIEEHAEDFIPSLVKDELELEIISQVVATVYNDNLEHSIPEKPVEEKKSETLITPSAAVDEPVLESKRSFSSWLKAGNQEASASVKPADPKPVEEVKAVEKQMDKIIDAFIEKEPTISRPKKEFYSPTKKAKESVSSEGLIYTETLADIFAIQGNFPKAIVAYEQLMLTNPEKKIFFAQRIKELKEKLNT